MWLVKSVQKENTGFISGDTAQCVLVAMFDHVYCTVCTICLLNLGTGICSYTLKKKNLKSPKRWLDWGNPPPFFYILALTLVPRSMEQVSQTQCFQVFNKGISQLTSLLPCTRCCQILLLLTVSYFNWIT